jgi:pyrroline-5-carboxylate reductase
LDLSEKHIFIIGTGNMGSALVLGLKDLKVKALSFFDIDKSKVAALEKKSGLEGAESLKSGLSAADIAIIAIKPQNLNRFLQESHTLFKPNQLIITIMAGIQMKTLSQGISADIQIVRAMPNTPALVGEALTAIAGVNEDCLLGAEKIFSCIGAVIRVKEEDLDAVTALSGAGPAYMYGFLESFIEAAKAQNFPERTAQKIVFTTAKGALKLLLETGETPEALRRKVTSPGGVTEAALEEMEKLGFSTLLAKGVAAGVIRAKVLGK